MKRVLQGSVSNLVRVLMTTLVGLVLPPFFVRQLPSAEYSAWVLIVQLGAYVNLLDLGLQTAIGKFVAEYESAGNRTACGRVMSTSFVILSMAALLGVLLIVLLTWQVPRLFHQMPPALIPEVRESLLIVGLSVAFSLPFGAFLATFIGLQRYGFLTILQIASKFLSSCALAVLLLLHSHLIQLAMVIAVFNVGTAVAQWLGWRRYARDLVGFSLTLFERASALRLVKYCSVLSIWTLAGLLISGLDTVIVGHFDYADTGYYAIATSVTNFILLIVGSLFSPLIPAVSSLQASGSPEQIGQIAIRTTRYCALVLCLMGLPLLLGAYPLLSLWVGQTYASHSVQYLEVLILGNVIRQLGYPYALIVVATGRQHLATLAGIAEALVNIGLSIWLGQRIGALGVAIGTVAGALVSITLHLSVSMHYTRPTIFIERPRFVVQGLLRPLLSAIPSIVLLPVWQNCTMLPASPFSLVAWAASTIILAWTIGLAPEDRLKLRGWLHNWYTGQIRRPAI